MASKSITIQPRDKQLLTDLLQSPYDASQLCKISQTFDLPFTDKHFVSRRMCKLRDAGYVNDFHYLTATDQLKYYKLTAKGYRFICGADKQLPARSYFTEVSPSLQQHTQRLADVLAQIRYTSHLAGVELPFLVGDKQLRLQVGQEVQIPDGGFGLKSKGLRPYYYMLELDCGTEPIYSNKQRDSLAKKLRHYYAHEQAREQTYRVLFLFNTATTRMHTFLEMARNLAPDPRRHIVQAVLVERFLDHSDPLRSPMFLDHDGNLASLLPCATPAAQSLVRNPLLDELVAA